jgi:HSP20 family protein
MFFTPVARPSHYGSTPRALDRSFERFFSDVASVRPPVTAGHCFTQDDKSWTLSMDLPGLAKDQLNIEIEGAVVRIESTESATRKVKSAFELPLPIDAAASTAGLEHGVLTLKLAKKLPVRNVSQLTIQ